MNSDTRKLKPLGNRDARTLRSHSQISQKQYELNVYRLLLRNLTKPTIFS